MYLGVYHRGVSTRERGNEKCEVGLQSTELFAGTSSASLATYPKRARRRLWREIGGKRFQRRSHSYYDHIFSEMITLLPHLVVFINLSVGNTLVTRSCTSAPSSELKCTTSKAYGATGTVCFCGTDLCNSALSLHGIGQHQMTLYALSVPVSLLLAFFTR